MGWNENNRNSAENNRNSVEMREIPYREELVTAVAFHENLTPVVARHKVAAMLGESWGPPAIRQMIQDEIDRAANNGRWPNIDSLLDTYQWCCENLPSGDDRRLKTRLH